MTLTLPPPLSDGIYSLRFYQSGLATDDFDDSGWSFTHPADDDKQAWSTGIRIQATDGAIEFSFDGSSVHGECADGEILSFMNRHEGGIYVRGAVVSNTAENPVMSPAENGVRLGPLTATLSAAPLTAGPLTIHWLESAVAKSATLNGTTTLGGTNAANLSAASIDRTTGDFSITFVVAHPPDANSITVDYASRSIGYVVEAW